MELSQAQIATLVLGYLRSEKCVEAMNKFIDSCQHFTENTREKIKTGKFVMRVYGMSLTDYLKEYTAINSIIQEKLDNTDYYNEKGYKTTLVDQLLYLLDSGIILNSTPITSEVETTPFESLPGNAVEKEDRQSAAQKTPTTPSRRRSARNRSHEKSQERQQALDVSEVWTQTLLENTELHARLAETINNAVAAAEKNRGGATTTTTTSAPQSEAHFQESNVSMGASKELDAIIKTAVQRTEEDPVYNKMINDLFECTHPENVQDHSKKTSQHSTTDVPQDGSSAVQTEETLSSRKRRKEQSTVNDNNNTSKKSDHPGTSKPHHEQQTGQQVPSAATIDQHNHDAISSIIAVSNVGSNSLPPPLPSVTSATAAALVVIPPSSSSSQQQDMTSLSSSSQQLSSAVSGVVPNETEVGNTASATALGATGDVTFFNGSLHKYLKASGGSCYNPTTVVSAVPNQVFLNTAQCTQVLVVPLPPSSSSTSSSSSSAPAPQQYDFQPTMAPSSANGSGQPSLLGINTIQQQQQQHNREPSSDNNVMLLSDADIMQMPTVIVNDGSPPAQDLVTVNQLRTRDVAGDGDRGRSSRYVHIAPKPKRTTRVPRDKSSSTKTAAVANVVPGRDMESLSPAPPKIATLMPKKPTPKHVRNLDFSTPPEPELSLIVKKKSSSWDADLRQMVTNCKDRTPPRIRKAKARRRLARAKDQAKVEGEEEDDVAKDPAAEAEESQRPEAGEEKCDKEAGSSTEKSANRDNTATSVVHEAGHSNAKEDDTETKRDEAMKDVQQCTNDVIEPENNDRNPETDSTEKSSRPEKEDLDRTIVLNEEQQTENNNDGRDFDQLMTVVNREKSAFVPPVTPLKDGIPSTTLNASYNSLTPFAQVLEDQLKGVDLCAIPTPKIPITPGFALTPLPDQERHRLTDYSTSSSYYQPSDTEQNKSIEQLIEESKSYEDDRSALEKSPNKLKILSDVVVQHCKPIEIAKNAQGSVEVQASTSALSTMEHLRKFNQKVIGKKNINLEHPPPFLSSSSSDDESSSTDSDSSITTSEEQPTVIQTRRNSSFSETVQHTTDDITTIIKTVEMKTACSTLVAQPPQEREQQQPRWKAPDIKSMTKQQEVLRDLEEKRQRTIDNLKTPQGSSSSAQTGRRKPSQKQQPSKRTEEASAKTSKPRTARPKSTPQKNKSENSKTSARRRKDSEPKSETAPTDDQSKKMVTDLWQRGIHLVPNNKTPVKQSTSTEPNHNNISDAGVPPKQPSKDPKQKVDTETDAVLPPTQPTEQEVTSATHEIPNDVSSATTSGAVPPPQKQATCVTQEMSKDTPSSGSSAVLTTQKQQQLLAQVDQLPPGSPSYGTANFSSFSTSGEILVTHDEKNTTSPAVPSERPTPALESFKVMVTAEGFGDIERTMLFTPVEFLLDMSPKSEANVLEPRRSKRVQSTGHKKPNYVVDGPSPEKTLNASPERSRGSKSGENSKTLGSNVAAVAAASSAGEKPRDRSPDKSSKNSKKRKARLSEDEPKPQQEKKPKCAENLLTNMNIDEFLDQIHGVN